MKDLKDSTRIRSAREQVWNALVDTEEFRDYGRAFSSDSQFEGEWKQGSHIRFLDSDLGGTIVIVEVFNPYEVIRVRHVSVITQEGGEDTDSEAASKWNGTTKTTIRCSTKAGQRR